MERYNTKNEHDFGLHRNRRDKDCSVCKIEVIMEKIQKLAHIRDGIEDLLETMFAEYQDEFLLFMDEHLIENE